MFQPPSAQLPAADVGHAFVLEDGVQFPGPMHVEDVVRAEGGIDHQLAAPVAVRVLEPEEVLLGAMDGQRDGISSAWTDCSGDHALDGFRLKQRIGRCAKHLPAGIAECPGLRDGLDGPSAPWLLDREGLAVSLRPRRRR